MPLYGSVQSLSNVNDDNKKKVEGVLASQYAGIPQRYPSVNVIHCPH
jgi:hypothetical protein